MIVNLKKVLILTYYFPPCNLTPAERVFSFASYLEEYGYYPIVITRNWDIAINDFSDEYKKTGDHVIHKINSNFEVYYVPFKPTFKDNLFAKLYGTRIYFIYLITAFIYSFGENFSSAFTSYFPLYKLCKKVLAENKDISLLIISGRPFHLFKFGFKLHKKFRIKWIADYRDDWSTYSLDTNNFFKILVKKIARHNEIKWVSTASFFTSVSDFYVKKIKKLLRRIPGHTIYNGYLETNYHQQGEKVQDKFTITYAGSIYDTQPIDIFLTAFKRFVDTQENCNANVIFIGLKIIPPMLKKVTQLVKGYEKYFRYTLRVSKKEAIDIQCNSTVLLAVGHQNQKGTPGSKLYEYIALKKPVLICPGDQDIIENTLTSTNQAIVVNNVNECIEKLNELYDEYCKKGKIEIQVNTTVGWQYTRKEQVRKLASLMADL